MIIISPEEAGERLDKVLAQRYKDTWSRSYFQRLIEEERVLLNGELAKKRVLLQEGDEIEIEFLLTPDLHIHPEAIPLDILYEDSDVLVINKPAGMVVHPAVGNWTGTFVNALLHHCGLEAAEGDVRPGIVHRLDKETSGVLIAAKNPQAHQRLVAQFAQREVYKEYLAICIGNPGNGTIDASIGRHPVDRKKMAIVEEGRKAVSHYRTLKSNGQISLVEVILETGRTHQIRVHLKHRNAPVLGDALYGSETLNKKWGTSRQLLHAQRLRLAHPREDKILDVTAPLPDDIKKYVDKIGLPSRS